MAENWSIPVKSEPWRERQYIQSKLFDAMSFFHWVCLCDSKRLRWPENGRAAAMCREISLEYWWWNGCYSPDVTVDELSRCDADLWNWGWLERIDESMAGSMIAESSQYRSALLDKNRLIGRRIFSDEGWKIWRMVEEHLRTPKGPQLRGQTIGDLEVFHQGVPFFVSQCCIDCTDILGEKGIISKAERIGPWSSGGVVMPHGWRLICEHPTRRDWTKQ